MLFEVVNLGCKVNRVESDSSAALLLAAGWKQFDSARHDPSLVDLVLVNTCAVTGEAEKKTRKATRSVLSRYPRAKVLVTGCAAALRPSVFQEMSNRVEVVSKARLEERISALAGCSGAGSENLSNACLLRASAGFPTRVGVKIQDGCNNACTYCVVHVARGKSVSRPASEVVEECCALAQAGAREIVLTGINLGSYCSGDQMGSHQESLHIEDLLMLLLKETRGIVADVDDYPVRFRLSSIEPCDVSEELILLLARAGGSVCRHLHLPLQSGSSDVLQRMNRPYTAQSYLDLVTRLYECVPGLALSTDIIVGFPGETEEQFQETLELARACRFTKIHVFPYSQREGTPAAAWSDQVSANTKAQRASELRILGKALREEDLLHRRGSVELALVEDNGLAMTESYYEFAVDASCRVGSLVPIVL